LSGCRGAANSNAFFILIKNNNYHTFLHFLQLNHPSGVSISRPQSGPTASLVAITPGLTELILMPLCASSLAKCLKGQYREILNALGKCLPDQVGQGCFGNSMVRNHKHGNMS